MNLNTQVARELVAAAESLMTDPNDIDTVADAYELLAGTSHHEGISERRSPVHDDLTAVAWCVTKVDIRADHAPKPWPGQAYANYETAAAWREFLEDYYRDTNVRDGLVRWLVVRMEARAVDLARGRRCTIPGTGYYRRDGGWVGTLPMEVYVWVQPDRRGSWEKKG